MQVDTLNIRGVDRALWAQVRQVAVARNVPAGVVLNEILKDWVALRRAAAFELADRERR